MSIALGIMCKAPHPGRTKTRLAAVVGPEQAAFLSACFLRDVASTIASLMEVLDVRGYGVYAPAGAEEDLRPLLPATFDLVLQDAPDFGMALRGAAAHLLRTHSGVILINSDSPTLPPALLAAAVRELARGGAKVVLGPAIDGGYTLIGVKADHPELFQNMPWSTPDVFRLTVERARTAGLHVEVLPLWYDVDDAESLRLLRREIAGELPGFATSGLVGGEAAATRAYLACVGEIES